MSGTGERRKKRLAPRFHTNCLVHHTKVCCHEIRLGREERRSEHKSTCSTRAARAARAVFEWVFRCALNGWMVALWRPSSLQFSPVLLSLIIEESLISWKVWTRDTSGLCFLSEVLWVTQPGLLGNQPKQIRTSQFSPAVLKLLQESSRRRRRSRRRVNAFGVCRVQTETACWNVLKYI